MLKRVGRARETFQLSYGACVFLSVCSCLCASACMLLPVCSCLCASAICAVRQSAQHTAHRPHSPLSHTIAARVCRQYGHPVHRREPLGPLRMCVCMPSFRFFLPLSLLFSRLRHCRRDWLANAQAFGKKQNELFVCRTIVRPRFG